MITEGLKGLVCTTFDPPNNLPKEFGSDLIFGPTTRQV